MQSEACIHAHSHAGVGLEPCLPLLDCHIPLRLLFVFAFSVTLVSHTDTHLVYPTNASRCMNLLILLKLVMIHYCCSYNLFPFCMQLLHFNRLLAMIFSLSVFSPVYDDIPSCMILSTQVRALASSYHSLDKYGLNPAFHAVG